MKSDRPRQSLTLLRLVLGVVVCIQSVRTAWPSAAAESGPHAGLAAFIRVLASVEIVGALLLLLPWTLRWGARLLLVVFAVAVAIHLLHGEMTFWALVVYAAALLAILAESPDGTGATAAREAA